MQFSSYPLFFTDQGNEIILRDPHLSMLPEIEIYSLHYHNVCEVGLCRCGSGLWLVGDSVTAIHGGDVMIVPPGIHHYSRTVGDPCMCEFIYFDEERLLSTCRLDKGLKKRLPKNLPSVIRDEKARSLLRSMIETRDVTESALWYALFLKWLPDDMELPETRDDTELSPAMRRIMLSYSEPLTMADLAAECGFCPSWFAKRFRQEYGTSPMGFLNDFRTKVAEQLLRGDLSVTEVAEMSGFGSLSDLYRHFQKKHGLSPTEFRRMMKKGTK